MAAAHVRTGARRRWDWLFLTVVAVLFATLLAGGAFATDGPSVATDKTTYAPGDTVALTGAGWAAGEIVHVVVDDVAGDAWSNVADVTTGSDGTLAESVTLPTVTGDYTVAATASSGNAQAAFTVATPTDASPPSSDPPPADTTTTPDTTPTDTTTTTTPADTTTPPVPPTIASDQADYAPGSTVTLTGDNWQPGESVHIFVNDDVGQTWSRNVDVTADGTGRLNDQFTLPNYFVADYIAKATGSVSGSASTTFTDASLNVDAAPSGVMFSLTSQGFTSSACTTPVGGSNGQPQTTTVTAGLPAGISFGSASFEKLTAGSASAPAGATFSNWTGPSGFNSTSTAICVATPTGGTNLTYVAHFTVPTNHAPVVGADNASVSASEGSNATNTGIWSDADAGDTVTLSASVGSVTKLGTNASGTWSWSLATTDGPAGPVSVTITANDGHTTSSTTFTYTVTNVAPVVTAPASQTAAPGVSQTFSLGSFTDPGPDNPWAVDVDWGDGTAHTTFNATTTGSLGTRSHTYGSTGTKTVTVKVTDKDGGPGSQTFTVSVSKLDQTISFAPLAGRTYGDADFSVAATATSGLAVAFGTSGDCTVSGTTVHITGAGSCTVTASQAGNGTYNAAQDVQRTFAIATASLSPSITADDKPYDTTRNATFTCTLVGAVYGTDDVTCGGGSALFDTKDVGTGKTVTATGLGLSGLQAGNYRLSSTTATDTADITPADATCVVAGYSGSYDTGAHGASGSCSGIGGETAGTLALGDSFTHVPGGTAHWTFTGNGNYKDQTGDAAIVLAKADASCSVEGYTGTYDGDPHGATGSCSGIGGESAGTLVLGDSFTHVAGGSADWSFTGNGDYNNQSGSVDVTISKADADCPVTPYGVTYDGDSHTAAGSCHGVKGEVLSGLDLSGTTHTHAGDYTSDTWTFTDATGDYHDQGPVTVHDTIGKAAADCSLTPYDVVYDTTAHTATGTCLGVKGESLDGLDLSGTTHTHAGDFGSDAWSFTDVTGDYEDDSGTVHDTIAKADASCSVEGYAGTYDGDPHGASGSCSGVGGESAGTLALGATFTKVPGGTALWSFTGNGDYNDQSGSADVTISKADADCSVTTYDVIYDTTAHAATGSCLGVKSETLDGLDLSGTTHTHAGDYTSDTWTFTDVTGNYHDQGPVTVHDTIGKADATCVVVGYSGSYDTEPHGASGSCSGIGGESAGTLAPGASFTHVPGGTAHWTFTGNGDYENQSGDAAIVLSKVDADCTIQGYTGMYDGDLHGASGSCSGVGGESAGTLALGATFTDVPGGTALWSFTGNGDYNDQSGSADVTISRADASCSVTPYDVTYNANPHTAGGSCKGVKGETLSGLDLSGTTHTHAGDYASDTWTFTDVTGNYHDQGPVTAHDKIAKADPTCSIQGYTGTFDGDPHGASGSCPGVGGENAGTLVLGDSFTHVPGGTAHWAFTGNGDYNDKAGDASIAIGKANATCTVTPYSVVLDGVSHSATGACKGVKGETLSGLDLSGTTHTSAGDYSSDPWSYTDSTGDYKNTSGTVHDNIHYLLGGNCLGSPSLTILQPINADGSSVFKLGSTVPAKFRACDANGNSISTPGLVASFKLTGSSTEPGNVTVNEDVVSTTPDTAFRWSASDQQWIFNVSTKGQASLKSGGKYTYTITLNEGSKIVFTFGLK